MNHISVAQSVIKTIENSAPRQEQVETIAQVLEIVGDDVITAKVILAVFRAGKQQGHEELKKRIALLG